MTRLAVVAFVAFVAACAAGCGHVHLPARPPADADAATMQAFEQRVAPRASGAEQTTITYVDGDGLPTGRTRVVKADVVVLKDGTVVRYAGDLLPVVASDGNCYDLMVDANGAETLSDVEGGTGAALAVGAVVLFVVRPEALAGITTIPVTSLAAAGGAGISFIAMGLEHGDLDDKRGRAFTCYMRSFESSS